MVRLIQYTYPGYVQVSVDGKVYTYLTSEYWARRAIVQMRFGQGYKGLHILKKNGEEVK